MQTTEKTDYFQDLMKYKAELAEIESHFILLSQKRDNLMKICESLEILTNVKVSPQSPFDQEKTIESKTETIPTKSECFDELQHEIVKSVEQISEIEEVNDFSTDDVKESQTESFSVKGMSSSKASAAFLRFVGKKLKLKQIVEGIRKYGYESNTSHPMNTLRTILKPNIYPKGELTYDTEAKLWGLVEWETDLSDNLKTIN
jgi:hypothetical protein